jgi:hypothetical protein
MARRAGVIAEIDLCKCVFSLVEPPDQKQPPRLEMARMGRVRPVAVCFEGRRCGGERLRGPGEVAGRERNLGFGDDASRASHGLFRAKGSRGSPHQRFRAVEIAELGHGDAAKRERRRVIAERDFVQRAEGITHRECLRGRRDQRVHRNPVTLVTPGMSTPLPNLTHIGADKGD